MIKPEEIGDYEYEGDDGHQCREVYLTKAWTKSGRELTDEELDYINDDHLTYFHNEIMEDSAGRWVDKAMDAYELQMERDW